MNKTFTLTSAAAALLLAGVAEAAAVSVTTTPGTSFNTTSLTDFTTTGADMDGMEVTVCTASGCEMATWGDTAAAAGAATGNGWKLSLTGNSFDSPFTFSTSLEVTSFSVNGRPGRTIFDIVNGDFLSPNSFNGRPFTLWDDLDTDLKGIETINVKYTDRLAVDGVFYGDLYTVMNVDFGNDSFTGDFAFRSDTDNAAPGSPIVPLPAPEPASLALVGLGLLGLAAGRRRSRAVST